MFLTRHASERLSEATKSLSELCETSFDCGFDHSLSLSVPSFLHRLRPAYTHKDSKDDEESLAIHRPKGWHSTLSRGHVDRWKSPPSGAESLERIETLQNIVQGDPSLGSLVSTSGVENPETKPVVFRAATQEDLDALMAAHSFPPPNGRKATREFQYHWFSSYRKLWALSLVANAIAAGAAIPITVKHPAAFTYRQAAAATGANFSVAVLMRQEHVINGLFHLACSLPHVAPLSVRKKAAKVYSYGGVHSGCGLSAFLWNIFTATLILSRFDGTQTDFKILTALIATTLLIFVAIILLAHPYLRRTKHDLWEISHRFGGWIAVSLVAAETSVLVTAEAHNRQRPVGKVLISTPTFWFLIVIAACIIYPWLRLQKRKVRVEVLSPHAVRLYFDDGDLPMCVGYKLARSPLVENHGFATIPNAAHEAKGYSIIVSNNGDFTKNMITTPPSHIYTRGAPVTGVMRVATLFRRVILVTTGSGIGPALSFMNARPDWPMRVIWSARDPEATYGLDIVNAVLRADGRGIIVDTKKTGHPNLPALTYAAYKSFDAEAIVVISNPTVTAKVVFELESRGVPAYGPIFDS